MGAHLWQETGDSDIYRLNKAPQLWFFTVLPRSAFEVSGCFLFAEDRPHIHKGSEPACFGAILVDIWSIYEQRE